MAGSWLAPILFIAVAAHAGTVARGGLEREKQVRGRIEAGETHRYTLPMPADSYARVVLGRLGTDVAVSAQNPAGAGTGPVEGPFDPGFAHLHVISRAGGEYVVDVTAGKRPGNYSIQLAELRPVTAADAWRLEAQEAERDGLALLGKVREAEPKLLRALELWQRAGDDHGVMSTSSGLAYTSRYTDNSAGQRDHARRTLALAVKSNDRYAEASARYDLGIALASLGEDGKGIEELEKAAELTLANNDPAGRGSTLNIVGGLYSRIGQPERALSFYQRALPIFRDLGNDRYVAASLLSIGSERLVLKQPAEAGAPLREALGLYRKLEDKRNQAVVLRYLADAAGAGGQDAEAVELHRQGIALLREIKVRLGLASSLSFLGEFHFRRQQWEQAAAALDESVALYRETGGAGLPMALNWLARVETGRGNFDRAQTLAEEALEKLEERRTKTGGEGARASFLAMYRPVYGSLVEALRRKGLAVQAFQTAERSRARGLADTLAQGRIDLRAGVDAGLLSQEAALEAETQESIRRNAAPARIAELRDRRERVSAKIREANPQYAAVARFTPVDIQELQTKLLDEDTALIEFFVGTNASYVWAIARDRVAMAALPGRAGIEPLVREAYQALTARNRAVAGEAPLARQRRLAGADAEWTAKSAALRTLLIEPVADALAGKKRWLVVADEALHYLPFAALPGAPEVANLPSASVLALLRETAARRQPAPKLVAAFADPAFGPDFARLPFSRREAEGILAGLPADKTRLALGAEASRATLAATDLAAYRAIHFATHGVLNEDAPELSGIVLAQDGLLRLHDLYNMKLPVELVVLSACQTALGKQMLGEGLIGLTRGILYAGATRVVSSLWKVDDAATAELMRLFYQGYLREGRPAAEALHRARTQLAAQRRWSAPYYWAAFQLQGEYR